jgi:hypothetical protein
MIYYLTQGLHRHSGMRTYAAGLSEVAGELLRPVSMDAVEQLQPEPGNWVIFDDEISSGATNAMARWPAGVRYALLLHSPVLQMDISNEMARTLAQFADTRLDLVLCGDQETARLIDTLIPGISAEWLPHCFPRISSYAEQVSPSGPRTTPPLCWMPMTLPDSDTYYRHKNPFCQVAGVALASASTGERIEVETNFASDLLLQFAKRLDVPLHVCGSRDSDAHQQFMGEITVGLCISLSESFSYNAAELMLSGVPVLFGPALQWAWEAPELVECCGVTASGSAGEIAVRLGGLLRNTALFEQARTAGGEVVRGVVRANHERARATLQRLAGDCHG